MSAATLSGTAALDELRADQLACMVLPALTQQTEGGAYLFTTTAAAGETTLADLFPFMPALDATGAPDGLLLGLLQIDLAQMVYVNSATPLSTADIAALLAKVQPAPDPFAYDPAPAGGVLMFHGTVALSAFTPLQSLLGIKLPDIQMQGSVQFGSGFPHLTLSAALTGPADGHLADAEIALGCPLYPVPGDAMVTLSGTVPISSTERVAIVAEVVDNGPVIASATLEKAGSTGLAAGLNAPGLPSLTLEDSVSLTVQLGRNGGWFTLDRIGFNASITEWEIVSGWVMLDSASFALQVIDPAGSRTVSGSVAATASFGSGKLQLTGTGRFPAGQFTLALAGQPSVADVLGVFGIQDANLAKLVIQDCAVTVDRQAGTVATRLALGGNWTIGPFDLTGLSLALSGPTVAAEVAAQFTLAGAAFTAQVEYASGEGWAVAATAIISPSGLVWGDLLGALGLPVPGFMDEVALEGFSLQRNAAGALTVFIAGRLAVGPGAEVHLTLADTPASASGVLTIGMLKPLAFTIKNGAIDAEMDNFDIDFVEIAALFELDVSAISPAPELTQCSVAFHYVP